MDVAIRCLLVSLMVIAGQIFPRNESRSCEVMRHLFFFPFSCAPESSFVYIAVITNLASRLMDEMAGDQSKMEDNQKYVGYLIKMFQAMENIRKVR